MNIEIHVYHHILTGEDALLKAEIEALRARLAAEGATPADLAALDALATKAKDLASTVDEAIAEDDAFRRAYGLPP